VLPPLNAQLVERNASNHLHLPQHKQDVSALDDLHGASREELRPHIRELLAWMQDMNWPVARPIAETLRRCGTDLIEPVRSVLRSADDVWKYWVLSGLLAQVDDAVRVPLLDDISRLANAPTPNEAAEEVDLAAAEVLALINSGGAWPPAVDPGTGKYQ
jgi:hypothetical protein